MAEYKLQNPVLLPDKRKGLLFPIAFLWGLIVVSVFILFLFEEGFTESISKYYLLPWTILTGAVLLAPSIYLYFKKKFDPFHPLVFPVWSYFFPAFAVGGLILTFNLSQPYYLSFVQDERYELPLTLVFVMLGFAGLTIGFALPVGRKIGEIISRWLPNWQWKPEQVLKPGVILLGIGLINTVAAFGMGLLGFQKAEEINSYDGIIFLLSLFCLSLRCSAIHSGGSRTLHSRLASSNNGCVATLGMLRSYQ